MRRLLESLIPAHWDGSTGDPNSPRTKWLQGVDDLFNRPVLNRLSASTNATAINCNGAIQSTGLGVGQLQPRRYAEFTVKARVSFNINSTGPAYLYVYRTLGTIPANGAAPGGSDVIVGGDAFTGGATVSGQAQCAAFSFLDAGLDVTKQYRYYFAIKGPNGTTLNLTNSSQLLIMERS
jgi:hypothetical protein